MTTIDTHHSRPSNAFSFDSQTAWWLKSQRPPETAIQALMESAPNSTPSTSIEELHAQRSPTLTDTLKWAMEALHNHNPNWHDAFVAVSLTGMGVREAALNLGTTKSTAHRWDVAAKDYLGALLKSVPIVAQHVAGLAGAWSVDDETGEPF